MLKSNYGMIKRETERENIWTFRLYDLFEENTKLQTVSLRRDCAFIHLHNPNEWRSDREANSVLVHYLYLTISIAFTGVYVDEDPAFLR